MSPTINYSRRKTLLQFARYALVGVFNTLLTLLVIYVAKGVFDVNPWVANAAGYVAGFINSFIWNKLWVFNSHKHFLKEGLIFISGFVVCYLLQLGATWFLTEKTSIGDMIWSVGTLTFSGYGLATLIGMGVYTIANFFYNRSITFK